MWVAPCSCLLVLADSKGMKSQAQISLKSMAKSLEKTPCSKKLGKFNPFCLLQKGQRVTYLVWHYPRRWSWEWLLTLATKDTAKVRSWKQEITQTRNQILAATINRELLSSWFFNEGSLKIRFLYIYIYCNSNNKQGNNTAWAVQDSGQNLTTIQQSQNLYTSYPRGFLLWSVSRSYYAHAYRGDI